MARRKFKHPKVMRDYWREAQRRHRAKKKAKGGVMLEVYVYIEKRTGGIVENSTFEYKKLVVSKAFTTEAKHIKKTTIDISRKGSIVKEKSRQLTEIALQLFPERHIPDEDLAYLVKRYCGSDKETVRAYMGYYGIVQRNKRTGEGYVRGKSRKGYLEIFDFMHRTSRTEWVIHSQVKLPQIPDSVPNTNEGLECSIDKISFSRRGIDNTLEGLESGVAVSLPVDKINNNNTTARERNFAPKIYGDSKEIEAEAGVILNAKPSRKKCVDCGRIDASNPYPVWCPKGLGERGRQDVCVLEG